MTEPLTILIAARDEESAIGATVANLRDAFPQAQIVIADDGSRDGTARVAADAGAAVLTFPRRGKGQALTLAEKTLPPGRLLLVDADLRGELAPLFEVDAEITIAAFRRRSGDGLGLAKRAARRLIAARSGFAPREPLSGQRVLSQRARELVFPVAAGFGVETRMTIDAVNAGLEVTEVELDLEHRSTGRDLRGFSHRGRQLIDLTFACGPQGVSFRGLRLPLVGVLTAAASPTVAPVALIGLADDLWSGPERGFREHVRGGVTTGTLKLVAIPLWGLLRTRSVSGAVTVGLAANVLNQLDTRPGRALKAFLLGSLLLGGRPRKTLALAVLIAPYDLREMTMLGDAGSNALGAVLGFESVRQLTSRGRMGVIAGLAALMILGERTSLGRLIETTPGLREFDQLGRRA